MLSFIFSFIFFKFSTLLIFHSSNPIAVDSSKVAELFSTGSSSSTAVNVTDGDRSIDDDAESLDAEKMIEVNSAIAVEKEIAADTLGTVFAATGNHFLPFDEKAALELVNFLPHYYEGIRKSATESLLEIIRTFYTLSDPSDWLPGIQVKVSIHRNVKDLIGHALPALLDMYETEDDKSISKNSYIRMRIHRNSAHFDTSPVDETNTIFF